MSAIEHTEGPWEVVNGMVVATRHKRTVPVKVDGTMRDHEAGMLALVYSPGTGPCRHEANARLIAAAPDLLAALKEMRAALALAMRVLATHELSEEWIALLAEAGVPNGIGVRAQAAIHAAEGRS